MIHRLAIVVVVWQDTHLFDIVVVGVDIYFNLNSLSVAQSISERAIFVHTNTHMYCKQKHTQLTLQWAITIMTQTVLINSIQSNGLQWQQTMRYNKRKSVWSIFGGIFLCKLATGSARNSTSFVTFNSLPSLLGFCIENAF